MKGHIRKRSSASWEVRYDFGANPATGKRRVATVTVRGDRKAAEKELRRLLRTVDDGSHVDPSHVTVRRWLETCFKPCNLKPRQKRVSVTPRFAKTFLCPHSATSA